MSYPGKGHPWSDFLHHRLRAIKWSQSECGDSVERLVSTFSCDETQMRLLLSTPLDADKEEERDMSDYLKALDNAVRVLKTHEARASRLAMKEHFDRGPFDPTSLQAEAYRRGVSECIRILDCLVDAKSKHVGAAKKVNS